MKIPARVIASLFTTLLVTVLLAAQVLAAPNSNMGFQRLLTGDTAKLQTIGGINAIVQDKQGFMWFAGEYGVARYDSHNFKFYNYDPLNSASLSSNNVVALALDKTGDLWLGAVNGLNRYQAETDSFVRYSESLGLDGKTITAVCVDENNNLYVGTTNDLTVVNSSRNGYKNYNNIPGDATSIGGNSVRTLYIDSHQKVWVGVTGDGLNFFDPLTEKFEHWRHQPDNPNSLQSGDVESIFEDHLGRIWVGSYSGGLSRMGADRRTFKHYRYDPDNPRALGSNAIRDIYEDHAHNLWIVTDHGGLAKYHLQTDDFSVQRHSAADERSLRSDQLRSIYEDRDHNLWIGGFPDGVNLYDSSKMRFIPHQAIADIETSLPLDSITALLQDKEGLIWIGSEGGLAAFNPVTGATKRYFANPKDPKSLRFSAVTALAEDADHNLWVGTWSGGLHRFNKTTQEFKNYYPDPERPGSLAGPYISQIALDHQNNLWVCFLESGGLARYYPETDSFQSFSHDPNNSNSLARNFVKALVPDSKGNLWIGTLNGLDKLNIATQTFTHYTHDKNDSGGIASNHILAVFEDSKGNIWVGTKGDGVSIFNVNTGHFTTLTTHDGLPSNVVSTIIEDTYGKVWMGTVNGVVSIDQTTKRIETYRKSDGLAGSNVNRNASLRDRQGHLWIGSTEGVTEFDPFKISNKITKNATEIPAPPKIVLTGLRIANILQVPALAGSRLTKDLNYLDTLVLNYTDTMFSIDYASLNYVASERYDYSYKLEGFDQRWLPVQDAGTATWTNLDPGHYVFKIRAQDSNNSEYYSETSLNITITPPFWETPWAWCLYLLMLAALEYGRRQFVALKNKTAEYKTLSTIDKLTGIYNRHGLQQIIEGLFLNSEMKKNVCLMIFDIDHFKKINDQRGHDAGDRVIQDVVKIVGANIRSGDHLARWGGEEFVLLCASSTLEQSTAFADKIRVAVYQHVFEAEVSPLGVTISLGIADCRAATDTFDQMLKRADLALYKAKNSGRNCLATAAEEPHGQD